MAATVTDESAWWEMKPYGCICESPWFGIVPPYCPIHNPGYVSYPSTYTNTTLTTPPRLTDEEIERIAERVAAKLRSKRRR
jgi:hypothetical protein